MIVLRLTELLQSTATAAVVLSGFFVLFYTLERWFGGDLGRYRTRHFWNDVVYALFYRGDVYQLLIGATVVSALKPQLAFLEVGLFKDWPLPASAVAFWITSDFLGYWLHRLQHRIPFLWAFHSVHHAQERMTFLTSYRIHPVEQLLASVIVFAPLLVIGLPTRTWLPLVAVLTALEFSQHSTLPWRFGPLYRVVVSPAFHAIHHSTEPRHYDRNFGKILSTWDVVFGTAVSETQRPSRFGVEGLHVPESLAAQLVFPFRLVRQLYTRSAATETAPLPPSESSTLAPLPGTRVHPGPSDVVATLLKSAGTTLDCELRGQSMGLTLPHGSRLRIQFEERPRVAVGEVVAFIASANVTVHRIVGRGRFGSARSYVLTRGDGRILVDHPVPVHAILGTVVGWKNGETWEAVAPRVVGGWRFVIGQVFLWPALVALQVHYRVAMAFTISAITLGAVFRKGRILVLAGRRPSQGRGSLP